MIKVDGVSQITGEDLRLINACLRIMTRRGFTKSTSAPNGVKGAKEINLAIARNTILSNQEKDLALREIIEEAKQSLLPLDELDWLKKNDRACYWAWTVVSRLQFTASPNQPTSQSPSDKEPKYATSYSMLGLNAAPCSTKDRCKEIVKFFDKVAQPLWWQHALNAHLKSQWAQIYSSRKPFSWLKQNNEDQVRWAWEYLSKIIVGVSKPPIWSFSPTGCQEMYLAIYAAFDSWDVEPGSKRLFCNDFNRAWQQKKHRDNRQGKKACNLVLREEVKQKLDDMAAVRGMKLNQLVEGLIESEYERTMLD